MTAKLYIFVGADGSFKRICNIELGTVISDAGKKVVTEKAGARTAKEDTTIRQNVIGHIVNAVNTYGDNADAILIRTMGLDIGAQLPDLYEAYKDTATFVFMKSSLDYSDLASVADLRQRFESIDDATFIAKLTADAQAIDAFVAGLGKEYVEVGTPFITSDYTLTSPVAGQAVVPKIAVAGSLVL